MNNFQTLFFAWANFNNVALDVNFSAPSSDDHENHSGWGVTDGDSGKWVTQGEKWKISETVQLNVISIYKTHFSSAAKDRHTWDTLGCRKIRIFHALHHRLLVADWQSSCSSVICQFFFFVACLPISLGGCYFSLENRKYFALWPLETGELSNLPRAERAKGERKITTL